MTNAPVIDDLPILFVDDETSILRALERTAEASGWRVVAMSSPLEALKTFENREYAVVVSDFRMPQMDGVDFLARVRELSPDTERILLTAYADEEALERGINDAGISRFLRKPWKREMLVTILGQAVQQARLRRENELLASRLSNRNEELSYLNELLASRVAESDVALQGFRRRWDAALNAISDPLIMVDGDYRLEGANDAASEMGGVAIADMEGRKCHEILFKRSSPCANCPMGKAEETTARVTLEDEGEQSFFDVRAYPLPASRATYLCTYRDVTRALMLERDMANVDKMAAIGRLAGGVAHEINNPLHGILSFVQLAQKPEVPPDKLVRYHDVIKECALRCRDIVQSLRDFSRQAKVADRAVIDLNMVCEKAMVLFEANGRRLEHARFGGDATAFGNSNQLQQVLVNLIHNAIDASPQNGLVKVSVETDGGEWVMAVEDQGSGVSEAERKKIFEPFYTTKPQGQGTGLGLSISHNIMREHGGSLRVGTASIGGARFEVRLPRDRDIQEKTA